MSELNATAATEVPESSEATEVTEAAEATETQQTKGKTKRAGKAKSDKATPVNAPGSSRSVSKTYSVTGSFMPTSFRFFQGSAEKIDALFDNRAAYTEFRKLEPVENCTHQGYLGTFAVAMGRPELETARIANKNNPVQPNPGERDIAMLSADSDCLVVAGQIRFVTMLAKPCISDNAEYARYQREFVEKYIAEGRMAYLMRKYLENVVNGRLLWRNKYGFSRKTAVEFRSSLSEGIERYYLSDASGPAFEELVQKAAEVAKQHEAYFILNVAIAIELGYDSEVFPSQPFLSDKSEVRKSSNYGRILCTREFEGKDQVILTGQKIGNALRTIDDWYGADDQEVEPIAVELYGARVRTRELVRDEKSYFELVRREYEELGERDRDFVVSCFIKGGLLSLVG
jgi:CRISPR-associated protein Csy3